MILDLFQIKLTLKLMIMKKHLLPLFLASGLILLFCFQHTRAQDKKSSEVHITITENDAVTTDTTFVLKEGQDPEMIKKVITHLAGEEMEMSHDVHMSHSGEKQMVWMHSDGDKNVHIEHMMEDINIDSIKEAHNDAKVLVIKNKDGEIIVKELDEEADHEMFFGGDEHGEHHEMMFIEACCD